MEGIKTTEITDIELVSSLIRHIKNPCKDLGGNNVRNVYLNEARRILPKIKNPFAKKILEDVIEEYE